MIDPNTSPEQILNFLGITEPEDIDVEAIGFACGATIVSEPLSGCEANIIGVGDKAIITVNSGSIPSRRRFSAGHELGHWMKDRGQSAFGCSNRQMNAEWSANNPETRANRFASDLLIPTSMFEPRAQNKAITVDTVDELSALFRMSRTATAIKLIGYGSFPSMLLYFEAGQRKWFIPKRKAIPQNLIPKLQLDGSTVVASLLRSREMDNANEEVRADRWFDYDGAHRYYIRESCFRTGPDSAVTILWWEDEQQILDLDAEQEGRDYGDHDDR